MAGIFSGGGNTTIGTRYSSLGLQTSQQGLPIPIIYGTCKVSGNLLWYGDFKSYEHKEGGKGGGPTVTTYTYSCAMIFGICEGAVNRYGTMWMPDGKRSIVSTPALKGVFAGYGLNTFYGTADQDAWSYLVTNHPDEALCYRNIAYLASSNFDLGQSNTLPQMWFEVSGLLSTTGVDSGTAAADQVVADFLTNKRYGCGLPSAFIDTSSLTTAPNSFANYCGVHGFYFSALINENKPARDYVTSWLEATNTAAVWSADLLKFIPFGDMALTGNGFVFTPDLTIRATLTEDDFVFDSGEEPISITRVDPHDCYNNVKVLVRDRNNEYNPALCEVKDQASIEQIGLRTRAQVSAEFLTTPSAGKMSAELIKNRGLFPRNSYRFRLSWEHALLEPMDLVALVLPDLGLDSKPVRIMEINEDDAGMLEITAEEFIEGSQWSVQYPAQAGSGYVGNVAVDPGNINTPSIFEPLASQIGTTNPEVWAVVSGGSDWGGARVWMSTDGGVNYSAIGSVKSGGITGFLTASMSSGDTTMMVDVSESGGTFASVTSGEAALGRTAMLVGSEVIGYTTASLTGAGLYTLSGLFRGMYGTTAAAHASTTRLGSLAKTVFKFTIPNASYYGMTVHLKFTSFNQYGTAEQPLDSVADYAYTITGAGSSQAIAIQSSVSGKPAAGAIITTYIAPKVTTFPANMSGSSYSVGTNPTSTAVFTLKKNGSSFCTASVSTGGVITFTGSATTFAAGDIFTVVAPSSQDATLANVAFLFKGTAT